MPDFARSAVEALFALDSAMGDVVARSTEPGLGRIKLAWWRERLQALDTGSPPAEPRLVAAAEKLLARGVSGRELAELEPGWATLLDPDIDPELVAGRGKRLFAIAARLIGTSDPRLDDAGAFYALASVGRRGIPDLLGSASEILRSLRGHRFARKARPLTLLARSEAEALRSGQAGNANPPALAMLAHRWSGRIG